MPINATTKSISNAYGLSDFNIPSIKDIPDDFKRLLEFGTKTWNVDLFDYSWKFMLIQEYEFRNISMQIANLYDERLKKRIMYVDLLTRSIVQVHDRVSGKLWSFWEESEKIILRHILLAMNPKTVDLLYEAYKIGDDIAKTEFANLYPDLEERLRKDFFVNLGSSSQNLDLNTQVTQGS